MPKVKETWMDVITTEMMEHICDDLCKYPDHLSGEALGPRRRKDIPSGRAQCVRRIHR